jgi:hypothetical protein
LIPSLISIPRLTLILGSLNSPARLAGVLHPSNKVNGGGQECPPHALPHYDGNEPLPGANFSRYIGSNAEDKE